MSQPLIIGAVTLAVVDTAVADLRGTSNKSPSFKIILGGFVVMVTLLAVSDASEELADSFAIIILLATLFGPKGGGLSSVLTKALNTTTPVPATPVVQINDPYKDWKVKP